MSSSYEQIVNITCICKLVVLFIHNVVINNFYKVKSGSFTYPNYALKTDGQHNKYLPANIKLNPLTIIMAFQSRLIHEYYL